LKKLLIITDSEYFLNSDGKILLFHSVLNEMESIKAEFIDQKLIGLRIKENRDQFLESKYGMQASNFLNLGIKNLRFQLFWTALNGVRELLRPNSAKYIHVRGPSIVMFVILVISPFFPKKKFWFKYANIWNEKGRSYFWDIQKWLLINNKNIKVTINGMWPNLPQHILPFENPCFFNKDLENRSSIDKDWACSKKLIFIGRITEDKGVFRILNDLNGDFSEMIFVGNGKDLNRLKVAIQAHPMKHKIKIFGEASKQTVMLLLRDSHLLLLPTTSPEGFPKVISEAWLNKCIPVTSDISSIPHYVQDGLTGFVWHRNSENWKDTFNKAMKMNVDQFKQMERNINVLLPIFTYEYFGNRVISEVFSIEK